MAKMESGRAP